METELVTRNNITFTSFKIAKRDWNRGFMKKHFADKTPSKESSRFIYFEVEGDLINVHRKAVQNV